RIRGLGVLHDPNALGQFLLMLLPMLFVSNAADERAGKAIYFLAIPISLFFLYGIYLTNSRGSALGVLVLIAILLTRRYRQIGIAASGIFAAIGVVALRSQPRSVSIEGGADRLMIWSDGLAMFKHSPLWGVGYYGFQEHSILTAHNSYLLCAAELGLIG